MTDIDIMQKPCYFASAEEAAERGRRKHRGGAGHRYSSSRADRQAFADVEHERDCGGGGGNMALAVETRRRVGGGVKWLSESNLRHVA